MNKTKHKTVLPSPKGGMRRINEKVIILLIIGLSTFLMPCLIRTSLYTPSATAASLEADKQNSYITTIVDGYKKDLEAQGYSNVSYDLTSVAKELGVSLKTVDLTEEGRKQAVLHNYVFFAEYTTISLNKKTIYYFKTPQESDNFIGAITKYRKINFTVGSAIKEIGAETPTKDLDKIIQSYKKSTRQSVKIKDATITTDNPIVNYALQFQGNPYVYGGTSLTKGADCSGFVQSVYKHFGVSLPRGARGQAKAGQYVSWDNLQPGDLVFYSGNGGKSITHVAMYIGNSKIIHASNPRGGIKVSSVNIMVKMTARRVV